MMRLIVLLVHGALIERGSCPWLFGFGSVACVLNCITSGSYWADWLFVVKYCKRIRVFEFDFCCNFTGNHSYGLTLLTRVLSKSRFCWIESFDFAWNVFTVAEIFFNFFCLFGSQCWKQNSTIATTSEIIKPPIKMKKSPAKLFNIKPLPAISCGRIFESHLTVSYHQRFCNFVKSPDSTNDKMAKFIGILIENKMK